jgi:hypothetical protein
MTSEKPPTEYFTGIDFNPSFYQDTGTTGLSEGEADNLYLRKTIDDYSQGAPTFQTGLYSSGTINAGTSAINAGTITGIILKGPIQSNTINALNPSDTCNILNSQTTGDLNIATSIDRTGTVNISTGALTATNVVNIGNATTNNQTLNLNSKTINCGDTSVASSVNIISPSIFTGLATFNGQVNMTAGLNTATANSAVFTNSVQANTKLTSPLLDGLAPDGIVSIASSQTTAQLIIGNSSTRTGTIYISNASPSAHSIIIGHETTNAQTLNIASKNINLGNSTVGSIVITKVPITVGHGITSNIAQLGGTSSVISPVAVSIASSAVTLMSFTNIPIGVYQVFYQISHTILTSTISFTDQRVILCDTENSINSPLNRIETFESVSSPGISRPPGNFTITGGGILVNTVVSEVAYLNVKYSFTGTGTLIAFGHIRLVRIG